MPQARSTPAARSRAESLREYGRGVAGGLLFSLPLLYTMEVWDAGATLPPHRQLVYLAGTSVLLLGYNRYAGLHPDSGWAEVVIDSVEELGIGLVLSTIILFVLGRIEDQPLHQALGRIVVEAMTVAIGVSVGTAQLGGDEDRGVDTREIGLGGHLVLAACGAVLFAANVAPTEEIVTLGLELAAGRLLLLALLSVALAGLILFFSDFRGSRRWAGGDGWVGVTRGIVITYAVGLVSAALILWLFGRFDGGSVSAVVGQTVALGVAATLGASAGRLLLLQ